MALNFGRALMGAHATAERQKLQKEQDAWAKEQADLQEKATKKAQGKSLWSSLGGKIGSLAGLAGPALVPLLAATGIGAPAALALGTALAAGGGSYLGRKAGEIGYGAQGKGTLTKGGFGLDPSEVRAAGPDLSKGMFHSGSRAGLQSSIDRGKKGLIGDMREADRMLRQGQLTGALTDAATAGAMAGGSDWMGDLFGDVSSKYMQSDILKNTDSAFDITDIIKAQGT